MLPDLTKLDLKTRAAFVEKLAKANLAYFCSEYLVGPQEAPFNGRVLFGPHQLLWAEMIAKYRKIINVAYRSSGKSYFHSTLLPVWTAWKHPDERILLFTSEEKRAKETLQDVKKLLESSPKLHHLIPDRGKKGAKWSELSIRLTNGTEIIAVGWGQATRGRHPKLIVVDDVLTDRVLYFATERERSYEYFLGTVSGMAMPKTQVVCVGTLFHQQDMWSKLLLNTEYASTLIPALRHAQDPYPSIMPPGPKDSKGRSLLPSTASQVIPPVSKAAPPGSPIGGMMSMWPEVHGIDFLLSKRMEQGEIVFTREFLCCRPGTMIETIVGSKPIEAIIIGDFVLTHTGAWRRVNSTMISLFTGELVRIKGELQVTPGHPIFTKRGWINAEALTYADQVTFPTPQFLSTAIDAIELDKETPLPFLYTKDLLCIYARGCHTHLPSGTVGKSGSKSIPARIPLSVGFMYLIGLWVAEGSIGCKNRNLVFNYGETELETLAKTTVELIRSIFGLEATIKLTPSDGAGKGGTAVVYVGNVFLVEWFSRHFGQGAENKRLPIWVRNLTPQLLWPLVMGYLDGDGHSDSTGVCTTSVSRQLLEDVRFALAKCGIMSVVSSKASAKGGEAIIMGRLCLTHKPWHLKISGESARAVECRSIPEQPSAWGKVIHMLQRVSYSGPVYNLEVEGDNSYVADGVAVHNCSPVSSLSSLFPIELTMHQAQLMESASLGMPLDWWQQTHRITRAFGGIDLAISAKIGADFTVVFILGLDAQGNRYILDIQRVQGMAFDDQLQLAASVAYKYKVGKLVCESNAFQAVFAQQLKNMTDLPIKEFHTGRSKHSLHDGVPSLRILHENQKYRLPVGDAYSRQLIERWAYEMAGFSIHSGKVTSSVEHDDLAMANYICESGIEGSKFQFTFAGHQDMAHLNKLSPEQLDSQVWGVGKRKQTKDWFGGALSGPQVDIEVGLEPAKSAASVPDYAKHLLPWIKG